ncbi:MAG TPA: plastocyanin/azurin family copper-binding protein [Solirubrobacterales bacterium]|nr:plastocyanin/azurin family copper-binding protein [Solirubrobacterales bacterium]
MSNETLFYICGIGLAVSAVLFSFIGLKVKNFPGKAFPVVVLWFAILVVGSTTFAVLHAQDEEQAKAAEDRAAGKEIEEEDADAEGAKGPEENAAAPNEGEGEGEEKAEPIGIGGTVQLAADKSQIAYDKTQLSTRAGKVTIDFTNPAPLEHDVAIEAEGGEEVAASPTITEGKTSVSAVLKPGTYTFFCTVPGHREAGMEGKLTVR